jgi:hypothetical protein
LNRVRENVPELIRLRGESASLSQELTRQIQMREHAELTLAAVYRSRSWKVSAPLRGIGRIVRGQSVLPRVRQICGGAVYRLIKVVQLVPGWRFLSKVLRRLAPGLHVALYRRVQVREAVAASPFSETVLAAPVPTTQSQTGAGDEQNVSAEEARILLRLRARSFKA